MEMKFTPGQWEILGKGNGTHFIGVLTEERQIEICEVDIPIHDWPMSKEEAEANAKLIAAAPEILNILKDAMSHASEIYEDELPHWYKAAHSIIKKATE